MVVGDGNNVISDGSGADVVIAGNGRNTITVTGSRNIVVVGRRQRQPRHREGDQEGQEARQAHQQPHDDRRRAQNRVTGGQGPRNLITVGEWRQQPGDGPQGFQEPDHHRGRRSNRVSVRGSKSSVTVGNGSKNRITVGKGTKNRIVVGKGKYNRITTRSASKRSNVCSLPVPPRSWRGGPAAYYRDTIARCRVVTR